MVLGGTSQIHATPLYSFSNEREQILAGCQVSVTYNFIVGEGTKNVELSTLAKSCDDFSEEDIIGRKRKMIDAFIEYLKANKLVIE